MKPRVVTRACNSTTLQEWSPTCAALTVMTVIILMLSTIWVQSLLIVDDVYTSLTYLKICASLCILTGCFLTMEFYNLLYVLDTSPLSDMHFSRYFHQICVPPIFGFFFCPLNSIFHRSEFLVFQKFNWSDFLSWILLWVW